ncbi:MAG TPA: DNA-3-methyladenine glycosylase [Kofleriaceae bacterium]|nr:DNA-3-methyladenine glycosylase [Kofleriaceae bacterium]
MVARLTQRFFARRSDAVARALLGKTLVCGDRAGVIVETEAYLGPDDLASHARFGKTERNAVMFGPGGVAYVYLIYGMYDMFNVVTGPEGRAEAVLVRALEPARGVAGGAAAARGPGKLTRALGISRRHNGTDLVRSDDLFLAGGARVAPDRIACGPRIGVDYAGQWADAPLRFWIEGHPAVSRSR